MEKKDIEIERLKGINLRMPHEIKINKPVLASGAGDSIHSEEKRQDDQGADLFGGFFNTLQKSFFGNDQK